MANNRRICACIGEENPEKIITLAQKVSGVADVIEIRLDYMTEPDSSRLVEQINTPLLFTNRAKWEGGLFQGAEEERIDWLIKAVEEGAAYVDLELKADKQIHLLLKENVAGHDCQLILSSHDFEKTADYSSLTERISAMKEAGADIGKLITTAKTEKDALSVLKTMEYARQLEFPLIAFCMGGAGAVTRIATCDLGGYMTYCAAEQGAGTAPGQIDAFSMHEIFSRY